MAKNILWKGWGAVCAVALFAGLVAKAGAPWFVSSGFGEAFEGRDGAALHFAAGEKLDPKCKKILSGGVKQAAGKNSGMDGWFAWAGCAAVMRDLSHKILMDADNKAGASFKKSLSSDQKRWHAAMLSKCYKSKGKVGLPELKCQAQLDVERIGLFNLWYYQLLRSNPEGIYPTEYAWIWDIDPREEPPNRVCLAAREPVNLRQSPLVNAKGGGKILGKLQAGSKIEGVYYFGRQEGPCKQWLYGVAGSHRGFVCTRLSGQELFKACP